MEQGPEDLSGLSAAEAREYILRYMTTLKLTEKQCEALEEELLKWTQRIELARSQNSPALALEAEGEAENVKTRRDTLRAEIEELTALIGKMRRQLPGLIGRERSIDPDLLEQELLIAQGKMPGDPSALPPESSPPVERRFAEAEAEAALEALKAKMGREQP
jgi:phage shock protein A